MPAPVGADMTGPEFGPVAYQEAVDKNRSIPLAAATAVA